MGLLITTEVCSILLSDSYTEVIFFDEKHSWATRWNSQSEVLII